MYMSSLVARTPHSSVQSIRRILKYNLMNVTSWLLRQGDDSSFWAMIKNWHHLPLYKYVHWLFQLRGIHCRIIFNPYLNPNPYTKYITIRFQFFNNNDPLTESLQIHWLCMCLQVPSALWGCCSGEIYKWTLFVVWNMRKMEEYENRRTLITKKGHVKFYRWKNVYTKPYQRSIFF